MIGPGQADAIGAVQVTISPSALAWNAGAQTSNYEDLRSTALSSGHDTFLVEGASHTTFADNVPIAQGAAFIDGIVTTFFERAAAYGDGAFDSAQCITVATPLLASSDPVAAVCPHAALGVIDPAAACVESTEPGQIDPESLRCGPAADDLALALSGLTPSATWLTRQSMLIPAGSSGVDAFLGFAYGAAQSPVIVAASVDTKDCGDAGMTSSSSSSSGSSSGSGSSGGMMSSGSGPNQSIDDGLAAVTDVLADAYDDNDDSTNCSCSGTEPTASDTTTSSGSCSGSSDPSSSGCSGSSSSADDSSNSSDSCSSGSSSSDSCSSGSSSSSDSCSSSNGGDDSCSGSGGGGAFDCSTAGPRRVRLPKLSILLMVALAVASPLRRRGRRRRARRSF
jgi:uncharacterized membrane protein YgcG